MPVVQSEANRLMQLVERRVGEPPWRRTAPGGTAIVQPADIAPLAHDMALAESVGE